jgi:hypothetical protein
MRPALSECRLSRIHHFLAQWIFFHTVWILHALFDAHIDGPSAVFGKFQVFSSRIIIFFPPIKGDLTVETHDVVGIGCSWFIIEAGFGELVFLISNAKSVAIKAWELTCVGDGDLCGHFRALDVFVFEALLFG